MIKFLSLKNISRLHIHFSSVLALTPKNLDIIRNGLESNIFLNHVRLSHSHSKRNVNIGGKQNCKLLQYYYSTKIKLILFLLALKLVFKNKLFRKEILIEIYGFLNKS